VFDVCEKVVLVIAIVGVRLRMSTSLLQKGTKAWELV
jgi:hypothetical protein